MDGLKNSMQRVNLYMLVNLPLDKNNKQIRIGDIVVITGKSGRPELGIIFKMTYEFVFTECPLFKDINKRSFKNVELKEKGFWNESYTSNSVV